MSRTSQNVLLNKSSDLSFPSMVTLSRVRFNQLTSSRGIQLLLFATRHQIKPQQQNSQTSPSTMFHFTWTTTSWKKIASSLKRETWTMKVTPLTKVNEEEVLSVCIILTSSEVLSTCFSRKSTYKSLIHKVARHSRDSNNLREMLCLLKILLTLIKVFLFNSSSNDKCILVDKEVVEVVKDMVTSSTNNNQLSNRCQCLYLRFRCNQMLRRHNLLPQIRPWQTHTMRRRLKFWLLSFLRIPTTKTLWVRRFMVLFQVLLVMLSHQKLRVCWLIDQSMKFETTSWTSIFSCKELTKHSRCWRLSSNRLAFNSEDKRQRKHDQVLVHVINEFVLKISRNLLFLFFLFL